MIHLCPEIRIAPAISVDNSPEDEPEGDILESLEISKSPGVSLDITASLSLRLGIAVKFCQCNLCKIEQTNVYD